MVSVEAFSELLEVLYSAPLDQEQWERFLALLSQRSGSTLAVSLYADSRLGVSCRAQGGSSPNDRVDVLAYNERYAQSDPFRAAFLSRPQPGIVQGDDLLPNQGLLRTDLYTDLLAPLRCRFATLMVLTLSLRRIELITIWRTIDQGPMDEDSNHLLQLVFPHIQKALEIRQVLGVARQRLAGAEAMADASSTAAFLLTRHGNLIHRNAAADALIIEGSAFVLQNGILAAADSQMRDVWRDMLFRTAEQRFSPPSPAVSRALLLSRTCGHRPLQLLVTPLPTLIGKRSGAEILVLATDPEKASHFPDDVLRALYGLTSAESDVANGLLMGFSLREISAIRHVTEGTVRVQMKSLMSKTRTTRQSELMRMLMSLPQQPQTN